MNNETWGQVRNELIGTVGKNNFVNWIEPLEFSGLTDGLATFLVPTSFMGNWVSRNFGDNILEVLAASGQKVTRVQFSVPIMPHEARPATPAAATSGAAGGAAGSGSAPPPLLLAAEVPCACSEPA